MKNPPALDGLTLYHAVRAAFPRPGSGRNMEAYCVGGALYNFFHSITSPAFPSRRTLAETLMQANPMLTPNLASYYADKIVCSNDIEACEDAWAQLRMALTEGQGQRQKKKVA